MKVFNNGLKWITAATLILSISAAPALAAKTTPVTDGNTAVPAVPRAIPDLIPYHKFDPPTSKAFSLDNLTISGDLRVRPEMRTNARFTLSSSDMSNNVTIGTKNNDAMVQQWVRLGFNYNISPDVTFFFQPQWSKSWGADALDANDDDSSEIFARQAFMVVRNFGIKGLTIKAGRQLVVWGNHRMMGHFDWNNIGWSHDGITAQMKLRGGTLQAGWIRSREADCTTSGGGCAGGNAAASTDADLIFVRLPFKAGGILFEPVYIHHSGGTGSALNGNRPSNQARNTFGARVVAKRKYFKIRFDSTIEGYWQTGDIATDTGVAGRNQDIDAYAYHIDIGATLPVPMQPRIGAEYNRASGAADANSCLESSTIATGGCSQDWAGFDQLFPTNHIHFGYMDRMAWKNMRHFSASLNVRPSKDSHFEIWAHKFDLDTQADNWYGANQAMFVKTQVGNNEKDIGGELDLVYTQFFNGNKVAWQIGYGVFFPGDYIKANSRATRLTMGGDPPNETWGYTQLWINF
jgi:hypothetical protein